MVDFLLWSVAGCFSALAMLPYLPLWAATVALGLGVVFALILLTLASHGFADESSWAEGSGGQLPLLLLGLVASEMWSFASAYSLLSKHVPSAFSERLGPVAAVYFSVSTWTTAGFGDIHPRSSMARVLVTAELIFAVATVLVVLSTAVSKAFASRNRTDG
jgi:hypothetical protein